MYLIFLENAAILTKHVLKGDCEQREMFYALTQNRSTSA
jgi:hypothetical protein